MSQEKVERRKYEKYNRKKLERQRKVKLTVKCIIAALVVGAIIGVPLGINYYRSIPKFVGDSTLAAFVGNYIEETHAEDVPDFSASEESSEEESEKSAEDELSDAIEKATGLETGKVDEDNVDEALETDDTESEADSKEPSEE